VNQFLGRQPNPIIRAGHSQTHGNVEGARRRVEGPGIDKPPNVLSSRHRKLAWTTNKYHQEFFAAVAADRVIASHSTVKALRDLAQDIVADGMSVRVVQFLEVVDVTENDRHSLRLIPRRTRNFALQNVQNDGAVPEMVRTLLTPARPRSATRSTLWQAGLQFCEGQATEKNVLRRT
jgi:hypothetical protein